MSVRTRLPVTWNDLPLDQTLVNGDGDTIFNDLVLGLGTNNLVLTLTGQQYTNLLSAALNGAYRKFPENYLEVIYPLIKAAKVDFCTQVDGCISDNAVTQQTIINMLLETGGNDPNSINPTTTLGGSRLPDASTSTIYPDPNNCDKDKLWAGIREMVDRVDQNGRDILEDLAVINDKIEQMGELIDLVPILGDTIKDIGDLFTETVPDLLNAYNGASSPTFLDNVACDLFDMVCSECRYPTYEEVYDYFASHSYFSLPAFSTLSYSVLWDLIKSVTGVTPEALWYSINVWQCVTLLFDAIFYRSYGRKTFQIWCSFGEDNPSDNWMVLCSGCGVDYPIIVNYGCQHPTQKDATIESLGNHSYRVTAGLRDGNGYAVVADQFGRAFTLDNVTAVQSNSSDCKVYGDTCQVTYDGGGIQSLQGRLGNEFYAAKGGNIFVFDIVVSPIGG